MGYIKIDTDGRITAASKTHHCGEGEIEVDIPVNDIETIHEYRYVDGEFVYDPRPVVPGQTVPTQEERITALENQLASYEAAYAEGVNEA